MTAQPVPSSTTPPPRAAPVMAAAAAPAPVAPAAAMPLACQAGRAIQRVLVVDDSRLQRRLLASSLAKWGYDVAEAGSGEDALETCRTAPPDLILSDWMMPGMTGPEFCEAFRAMGSERYVYFILLTSKSEKGEVVQGLEKGADDFISKPVAPEELKARIAAAERLLGIERELSQKNRLITETHERLKTLYDALDRDLAEAQKLHESLVPVASQRFGRVQVSFLFRPSGRIGGDLLGCFEAEPGRIGVYSLDVSGHGIASGLVTARLAAWLRGSRPARNLALVESDGMTRMRAPDETCQVLDRRFQAEIDSEHYFTLALARIDTQGGEVSFAQAGHPHPLVQRACGRIEFMGDGGMPIGLLPEASFGTLRMALQPGDRLFLYSDGITEAEDDAGRMLDEAGLAAIFAGNAGLRGDALLARIDAAVSEWRGGAAASDDLSGVLIEFD